MLVEERTFSHSKLILYHHSACYAGKRDWETAASDAKECIRLDPTFVKGYYRLASAQIELKEWDAATATIKQGLSVDENNPQLLKLMKTIKQAKKAEAHAATAARPTRAMDATMSNELAELQQQYIQTNREYNTVKANIVMAQREYKTDEITKAELEKLPQGNDAKMYRGIGKMFLLSSRDQVMDHLDKNIEAEKKREGDLTQKLEYLERRIASQRSNMQELLSAK